MDYNSPISVKPIGVVHCQLQSTAETPKNFDESEHTGTLEIFPQYREALAGIEAGQTVVAVFWLHEAERNILKVYPRGDRSRGLQGVFNTRSPMRPNPIAISEVKVISIEDNMIQVFGVDVLNGTPLLDIKKKLRVKTNEY